MIRKSEINYYQNIFNERKNNIKDMWKHFGFLLNPNKNNSQNKKSVSKLNINGKTITEDKNIANAFSEYSDDVGSNLANKIVHSHKINLKSCKETMAMFALYWIGFCSISKVAPIQCEQELMSCCGAQIVLKHSQCEYKPYPSYNLQCSLLI